MVGGNSTTRSAAECTPDELLFEILLRLSAQDIYHGARLVCRKWNNMTRTKYFVQKHFEQTSYGLLYRDEFGDEVFVSARAREDGGGIDKYKLNYIFRNTISSSCNGLILEFEWSWNKLIYYVASVSRGQAFRLPPFPYSKYHSVSSSVGYDATSMTYKVVVPYGDMEYEYGCAILTVGVDKSWRRVRTDHLSDLIRCTTESRPIITEGFVHWNICGHIVWTLNLETEIISETASNVPKVFLLSETTEWRFISTGRYLSLFLKCGTLSWDVFEMTPKTGEWRKLTNICLEGQKGRLIERFGFNSVNFDIEPCGWLKYPEVLALRIRTVNIIFYNFITCQISVDKLAFGGTHLVTLHKNSLVWF